MQKIEHVRDFLEKDIMYLAAGIISMASGRDLLNQPSPGEMVNFQTGDLATVLGAILKVIEENAGEGLTDDVVELLYVSQKTVKRSVEI